MFLHLGHNPLPFLPVWLSEIWGFVMGSHRVGHDWSDLAAVAVCRLQGGSCSCFFCLLSGGWGYLKACTSFPDGRVWWWVELVSGAGGKFNKTWIHLSADGWSCVPSLLIVWPEVTRHWSLRLYGGAVGGPWEGFHPGVLSRTAAVSALVAGTEPQPPLASADLPTLADRLASASSVVTAAFLWVLLCTRLYVSSMRESLLSPILCKFYNQIEQTFKVRFSGDS